MVQGIIIDTFAALKTKLFAREYDEKHKCFICGIDREKLDKNCGNKNGYYGHIKQDHYMWAYLNFIGYIQSKKANQLTGVEQYILDMIKQDNINWFPIKRTQTYKEDEEENDQQSLVSKIKSQKLTDIITEMKSLTKQFGESFAQLEQ